MDYETHSPYFRGDARIREGGGSKFYIGRIQGWSPSLNSESRALIMRHGPSDLLPNDEKGKKKEKKGYLSIYLIAKMPKKSKTWMYSAFKE